MAYLINAMRTLRELQTCNTKGFTRDELLDHKRQLEDAEIEVDEALTTADWMGVIHPAEVHRYVGMLSDEERGKISDGYHTFDELYTHRIELFITLCRKLNFHSATNRAWRSVVHSDCSIMEGFFILGIDTDMGQQITYHIPMSRYDECDFAIDRGKAPEFDGHTPADVLERLKKL